MSAKKFYKKYANRKTRRAATVATKGCSHKKVFDLWWTLY